MPKGSTRFTKRVNKAVEELIKESNLGLIPCRSRSLFSPILDGDHYRWVKLMDSDGLLVGSREIKNGEGADPAQTVELRVGVVIQSEDSTSQTKPNPFGKASIAHTPNGVWVDLQNGTRIRLDRLHVLFLLPEGSPQAQKKKFETAKRNVKNAADAMPDCDALEVNRGIAAAKLVKCIRLKIGRCFKGRGRPRKKKK